MVAPGWAARTWFAIAIAWAWSDGRSGSQSMSRPSYPYVVSSPTRFDTNVAIEPLDVAPWSAVPEPAPPMDAIAFTPCACAASTSECASCGPDVGSRNSEPSSEPSLLGR